MKTKTLILFLAFAAAGTCSSDAARFLTGFSFAPAGVSSGFPVVAGGGNLWTAGTGNETLQPLDNYSYAEVNGISADGKTIIGYSDFPGNQACSWNVNNLQPTDLGFGGRALGVSSNATVIVGTGSDNGYVVPVRWSGGNVTSLSDDLFFQNYGGVANGVSADGQFIVGYLNGTDANGNGIERAVEWRNGQPISLGILNAVTNANSYSANFVSADGNTIVGTYAVGSAGVSHYPFRWTVGGGMAELNLNTYFIPSSMSADGQVIVGSDSNNNGAAIWTLSTGVSTSLGSYLANLGVTGNLGYFNGASASAISPDGRWVVGNNYSADGSGYLVDLFTPTATNSTPAALAAGAGSSNLVWSTSNDSTNSPWAYQNYITHDGVAALESGHSGSQSVLQATVTGPGTLSFWWRVSSSANASNLTFSISGKIQTAISGGDSGWIQESFAIPAGTQILKWIYTNGIGGGIDSGWVWNVYFTNSVPINNSYVSVFTDNFDTNSAANWFVNKSSTDTRVTFQYDYSADGIPPAPHSVGGTTLGVKFEANLSNGVVAATCISPIGKSFTGDYRLRFDLWINVNICCVGSTEEATFGIGTAGNQVEWNGPGSTADGYWFSVDGEGGVSDTSTVQGDFAAWIGSTMQSPASGVYASGTNSNAEGNNNAYYTTFFPGGQTAPQVQLQNFPTQAGSLAQGTIGFGWHDVIVNKSGSNVTWFIDGIEIAAITNATLSASNIFLGYWDPFASLSDHRPVAFGLVDNVRVEVPTPQMLAPTLEGFNMRVNWQGNGGSSYVLQSATNLIGTNVFRDISPVITVSGSGLVTTNYLDAGALTNSPARFYRIRSN
jgi:hypothetical protein